MPSRPPPPVVEPHEIDRLAPPTDDVPSTTPEASVPPGGAAGPTSTQPDDDVHDDEVRADRDAEERVLQGPQGRIDPIPDTRDALKRSVVQGKGSVQLGQDERDRRQGGDEEGGANGDGDVEGEESMIGHGVESSSNTEDAQEQSEVQEEQVGSKVVSEQGDDDEGTGSAGDDDDEDDDENDEQDSTTYDEEEPTLKYARLGGATTNLLLKDSASALAVCAKYIVGCLDTLAMGTYSGAILVLDHQGQLVKIFKPHTAMINDLNIDTTSEFIAAASMDGEFTMGSAGRLSSADPHLVWLAGKISVQSLRSTKEAPAEAYSFDLRRPMRCVALEPNFGKRNTRQLVSGGMAGNVILHEKGWLGYKETTLFAGEGPIWTVAWRANFIAWTSDAGVRIYDTSTSTRITYIPRAVDSPRADLFKSTLHWQNDRTLLIAWADIIKVAVVKTRETKRSSTAATLGGIVPTPGSKPTETYVEVNAIFQVDCMISGIAPYGDSYLILAYLVEDTYENEATQDRDQQRRKAGQRPELRIISKEGDELSSDALSLRDYDRFQCRDYSLCRAPPSTSTTNGVASEERFFVISPQDIVVARPRDEEDHVAWLIEQRLYEQALEALEVMGNKGVLGETFDVTEVGRKYLDFLVEEGESAGEGERSGVAILMFCADGTDQYEKAAEACPKILGINAKLWEDFVFLYADRGHINTVIPYVPTHDPQLGRLVYEMILAYYLRHDPEALLQTIKTWPCDIYDTNAVLVALQAQLERTPSSTLMEALAELYVLHRQPGKAVPYFLKLRRREVFELIAEWNLFTDVMDLALELVEFEEELRGEKEGKEGKEGGEDPRHGKAIELLVNHTHSIPVSKVIAQLKRHRRYLYMYLDALFDEDPHLAFDHSDLQVNLYAEYDPNKLMDFLRASNYYSLERAYDICDKKDLVPEMVFLLGRMGDNKRALNLIIERLGDVQRAIEFAKEQNDHDLWEDLLKYSETKPRFIRGLLENVGPEIDPIRLIRRIRNGLEIPGLKPALIKILQDFNLQISLMEGCKTILYSDCRQLALALNDGQSNGFLWTGETTCKGTGEPIFPQLSGQPAPASIPFGIHFLSGETFSSTHAFPSLDLPRAVTGRDTMVANLLVEEVEGRSWVQSGQTAEARAMSHKIRFLADVKAQRGREGDRGPTGITGITARA
ncbi:BZ3500_MvSof-1268-A1-R1_Chr5-2g07747 [Microbotryum saponariae]|uniref:BZ3500_MvSof-1268-A1-R1_Chr5-2g07747 protein n=1 Tax=Microbotryum saponariae TaxID=289078 RepID=A0A2X0MKL2_9BASI|nr:BZ3500_MvSof-1268-A1-R1_Chr5-2g07747 [Microbotryum saponariae]SDA05616.1 BZ3501_MvSof-1269-A2-R1_Chr5-2g07569 [Microbotryum saponariae]